jgi:hypothetical protein
MLVQEVFFDASLKSKFSKTVSSMALLTEVKKQKGGGKTLIDVSTWPSGADQMSPLGLQDLDNVRSH